MYFKYIHALYLSPLQSFHISYPFSSNFEVASFSFFLHQVQFALPNWSWDWGLLSVCGQSTRGTASEKADSPSRCKMLVAPQLVVGLHAHLLPSLLGLCWTEDRTCFEHVVTITVSSCVYTVSCLENSFPKDYHHHWLSQPCCPFLGCV